MHEKNLIESQPWHRIGGFMLIYYENINVDMLPCPMGRKIYSNASGMPAGNTLYKIPLNLWKNAIFYSLRHYTLGDAVRMCS